MKPAGEKVPYELIRSSRKTVALQIGSDGTVTVRAPRWCSRAAVDAFVAEKEGWIGKKLAEQEQRRRDRQQALEGGAQAMWQGLVPWPQTEKDCQSCRRQAAGILAGKAAQLAPLMGVTYQRITVRDQKTRWGSCSAKGNLNFNWRLLLAPEPVMDYVVVHELAHRREMNHSPRFWKIVEETMPDYRRWRTWLREYGELLMEKCGGERHD